MKLFIAALLAGLALTPRLAAAQASAPNLYTEFLETRDFDLAAGAARRLEFDGMNATLRRKPDGAYLVVVGPKPIAEPRDEMVRLVEERSPRPIGFSDGADYGPEIAWRRPATVLARAPFKARAPARLSYDGLNVDLAWRRIAGGEWAPVMTGRIGAAVVFRSRPRADAGGAPFGELRLMRLDPASPRPAVVMTAYTGGMHCCTTTTVATLREGAWSVAEARRLDADGYAFEDVDGDGSYELASLDGAFLYAFAPYNGSFQPTRVSRVAGGEIVDVTALPAMRPFLRQSVHAMEFGRAQEDWRENGFLGAWVAAKSVLGEGRAAWARMLELHQEYSSLSREECPNGEVDGCPENQMRRVPFLEALGKHLREHGYPLDPAPGALGAGAAASGSGHVVTALPAESCARWTIFPPNAPPLAATRVAARGPLTLLKAEGLAMSPAPIAAAARSDVTWLAARPGETAAPRRGALEDAAKGPAPLEGGPALDASGSLVALMRAEGAPILLADAKDWLAGAGASAQAPARPRQLARRLREITVMIGCAP